MTARSIYKDIAERFGVKMIDCYLSVGTVLSVLLCFSAMRSCNNNTPLFSADGIFPVCTVAVSKVPSGTKITLWCFGET